jgi:hypothetical protein
MAASDFSLELFSGDLVNVPYVRTSSFEEVFS